jgi:hypothetical protein
MKNTLLSSLMLPLIFSLLLSALSTHGQNLRNIQKESVRAPDNIKIDGMTNEWHNQFQAYNKNTDVFYTIANDDTNLYLVVKATSEDIVEKIVKGGVTFTIKTKDKNNVAITFPMYDKKNPPLFLVPYNLQKNPNDTVKNKTQSDSIMSARNRQLTDRFKIIGIIGIKAIEDSVISIYNEEGIKAKSLFDHKIDYTYELSIPLEYLKLSVGQSAKFTYNIKLNGATTNSTNLQIVSTSHGDMIMFTGGDGVNYRIPATPQGLITAYPTDFSGEYTLSDKR